MSATDFYQSHLDRVSRSFAFCIAALEVPLRKWVGLTYLVCRILDTVEDAPWKKPTYQLGSFYAFDKFLMSPKSLHEVIAWGEAFPPDIPEGEKALLLDSRRIFEDLHQSPAPIRTTIQEMVISMSAGMQHFIGRKQNGELRLAGLREVNQYCFFVAGIVGETLAKLVAAVDSRVKINRRLLRDAHSFGLFLQKVNLLKDQKVDESQGKFLIPSRTAVFASVAENAEGAFRYIETLPVEQRGYRLFCSWSLFIGLASLPFIEESYQTGQEIKIPREQTVKILEETSVKVDDPEQLADLYRRLFNASGLVHETFSGDRELVEASDWLVERYRGSLDHSDLVDLGIA